MGFRSTSTRRTSAASAVSSQVVMVNNGTGFTAVGANISSTTSISLGVTTVGQTSADTTTTVSSGPSIGVIQYLDTNNAVIVGDTAVSTAGGNILINGTGFVANSNVYVNNTLVSNTFISSTQIRAILPAASSGNVSLMIFTPTNVGSIKTNGVRYSGVPSWTTSAVSFQNGTAANVSLVASSDSTLTYTLQAGSTLPTGISLESAGYLSGTPTGYSTNTSSTVIIIATDAEGQATQQTLNITVTVSDTQFPYTTLLLNGETLVTPFIADASSNNFGLTIAGDTKANKFSPYCGDGYYSNLFNGSSDKISVPSSSTLAFGAGDFTIEAWFYINGAQTQTYGHAIVGTYDAGSNGGWGIVANRSTDARALAFVHANAWQLSYYPSAYLSTNTWHHVAVARSGTAMTMYLNGVSVATATYSTTDAVSATCYIGSQGASSCYFPGYISNVRMVKGTTAYTGAFTPPTTPLTAVANTQLLTCQSNRFLDKSTNAAVVTATGTTISPVIPFAASSSYATYGSAYFDGTGDYLTAPNNAAYTLAGDFTIEGWSYFAAGAALFSLGDGGTTTGMYLSVTSVGTVRYYINSTLVVNVAVGAQLLNSWNHYAVVRSGTTITVYVNGTSIGNGTNSATFAGAAGNGITMGGYYVTAAFNATAASYLSDFRIVNGTAVYTTTFTPPTSPLTAVANTQLLTLQYNGGATNSGIVDNGPFNAIVTKNGNASQGTFSPYSQTGWSNYFNGSTDYLTVPATSTAFGTSAWTIEGWFYITSLSSACVLVDTRNSAAGNNGVQMSVLADGSLYWFEGSASSIIVLGAGTITTNRWYHIAFVRSNTSAGGCALYIDGVSRGTGTSNLSHAGYTTYIGRNSAAAQDYMKGYISNLRIVNGSAVYIGAFTPSAMPLTAVTNTSILTCQSNQFKDNSNNNSALTLAGTPKVQAFSPFSPSAAYNPVLHGGSMYFDGTGDFLSMPGSDSTNIGISTASAFTVEAWVYPTVAKDTTVIGCAGSAWRLALTPSKTVSWVFNTSSSQTSTDAIKLNQWNHIAFTYDGLYTGTSNKIFVNGIVQAAQGQLIPSSNTTGVIYVGRNPDSAAWDFQGYISGVRIIRGYAAYTANFTLPTAPFTSPITTPASLLLNFTNGGVVDAHSSNNVETVGNVQLSTSVKKYGTASMYFDGTGDYIDVPNDISNQLSGAIYTIEMWLYPTVGGVERRIFNKNGASTYGWLLSISTTDTIQFRTDSTNMSSGALTAPINQWTHVAVTYDGTTTRIFVNGQLSTSATGVTITNANELGMLRIGSRAYQTGSFNYTGYMDDIRITKGVARYTANFTPPTTAFLGQ